jgi:hypothetical protein
LLIDSQGIPITCGDNSCSSAVDGLGDRWGKQQYKKNYGELITEFQPQVISSEDE